MALEDFIYLLSIVDYKSWSPLCEVPFSLDNNPENLHVLHNLDIIRSRPASVGCITVDTLQVIYLVVPVFISAKIYA